MSYIVSMTSYFCSFLSFISSFISPPPSLCFMQERIQRGMTMLCSIHYWPTNFPITHISSSLRGACSIFLQFSLFRPLHLSFTPFLQSWQPQASKHNRYSIPIEQMEHGETIKVYRVKIGIPFKLEASFTERKSFNRLDRSTAAVCFVSFFWVVSGAVYPSCSISFTYRRTHSDLHKKCIPKY